MVYTLLLLYSGRLGSSIIKRLNLFIYFVCHQINNDYKWLKVVTVGISAAVTVAGAVEEFSQFGDKWFRYRRTAEVLKSQGWQFMQRSGPYREFTNHRLAFPMFAEQVEGIIQRDVEVYVEESLQSRRGEKPLPGMSDGGHSS